MCPLFIGRNPPTISEVNSKNTKDDGIGHQDKSLGEYRYSRIEEWIGITNMRSTKFSHCEMAKKLKTKLTENDVNKHDCLNLAIQQIQEDLNNGKLNIQETARLLQRNLKSVGSTATPTLTEDAPVAQDILSFVATTARLAKHNTDSNTKMNWFGRINTTSRIENLLNHCEIRITNGANAADYITELFDWIIIPTVKQAFEDIARVVKKAFHNRTSQISPISTHPTTPNKYNYSTDYREPHSPLSYSEVLKNLLKVGEAITLEEVLLHLLQPSNVGGQKLEPQIQSYSKDLFSSLPTSIPTTFGLDSTHENISSFIEKNLPMPAPFLMRVPGIINHHAQEVLDSGYLMKVYEKTITSPQKLDETEAQIAFLLNPKLFEYQRYLSGQIVDNSSPVMIVASRLFETPDDSGKFTVKTTFPVISMTDNDKKIYNITFYDEFVMAQDRLSISLTQSRAIPEELGIENSAYYYWLAGHVESMSFDNTEHGSE